MPSFFPARSGKSFLVAAGIVGLTLTASFWPYPTPEPRLVLARHLEEAAPGRLLVKFEQDDLGASISSALNTLGIRSFLPAGVERWRVLEFDPADDLAVRLDQIRSLPSVVAVEPDYLAWIQFAPDDPIFNLPGEIAPWGVQWNLAQTQVPEAWDLANGAGVTVAVLDTGLASAASDVPVNTAPGLNAVLGALDPANTEDDHGHGSHVSGTVAQATDNGIGGAGIAFGATIMPVKVCAANGSCSSSAQSQGLAFARQNGAGVVNMSLGGTFSQLVADAVAETIAAGIPVVAAMGNGGSFGVLYPAALPDVIAVGATRFDQGKACYSNAGTHIWMVAPGGQTRAGETLAQCLSGPTLDQNGDGFPDGIAQQVPLGLSCGARLLPDEGCFKQGTSMATSHVTAVIALMLSKRPNLSTINIRTVLKQTAADLGTPGFDSSFGHGMVQTRDAVAAVSGIGCNVGAAASSPAESLSGGLLAYLPLIFRNLCAVYSW